MQDASSSSQIIHFSTFELDVRAGELRKQGVRIKLQEQPFRILEMLLANPGQLVTREELRNRLWQSDTFVDFDHGLNKAINKLREALGDSAESPQFIETLAKRGYRFLGDTKDASGQIRSLLVLPLQNLSRDPDQEYFADGLTEVLITYLAKISALRVISRTTAMYYKGAKKTLPEIARELGVEGVVEGTVLRSGERIRVSAQLIHAPTDAHLWAESYERDLRDVLALQSEMAQAIANEVRVKLTPREQAQFDEVRHVDPDAYEAYLKGRYHLNGRTRGGLGKAVQCFQQATATDPGYAAAYSGLADCLCILSLWGLLPPEAGCGKARGLALQALALEPDLAEAHTSLAWSTFNYDYDFVAAEKGYKRSIQLNQNYDTVRRWYGISLSMIGRYEEGRIELENAIRLDPCSSGHHWALGFVHWRARKYEQAIAEHEKSLELEPNFGQAHWGMGIALSELRPGDSAITHLRKACELTRDAPITVASLAEGYAAAGQVDEARGILNKLPEITKQDYVMPYFVARIHATLGQNSVALDWLEKGYQQHAEWMPLLKTDARFDALRADPRFESLLRRMNFPP